MLLYYAMFLSVSVFWMPVTDKTLYTVKDGIYLAGCKVQYQSYRLTGYEDEPRPVVFVKLLTCDGGQTMYPRGDVVHAVDLRYLYPRA